VRVSEAKRRRTARNQLVNRAHLRYVGWHIDRADAAAGLAAADITGTAADELLGFWDAERGLNVHTLSEAQVVRAFRKGMMDRATAEERLLELGLAQTDIAIRLDE
jgi:aminoglycoside phosphotransferase (APT) family kinase protein